VFFNLKILSVNFPMASSTSTSSSFIPPNLDQLFTTKLDGPNYLIWSSELVRFLVSNGLMGFVDGSEPCPSEFRLGNEGKVTGSTLNPEFLLWTEKDQFVLGLINASLADNVVSIVFGLNHAREAWLCISNRFASQTRSRINRLVRDLQSLHESPSSSKGRADYTDTLR